MARQDRRPPGSHEPTEYAKTPKKAAASGWIGSALEYYDFFIYAQAAALVFPTLFFPSDNAQVGIVASFATFGVGYVARPYRTPSCSVTGVTRTDGRTVLVLCMLLIGASTFGVALLPTYEMVGIWAPILLVILRLIQGFAVGGEISGASAMILEHSPFGERGYYGSFTLQGVQAGPGPGGRDLPAAVGDHAEGSLRDLGLANPVPAQCLCGAGRLPDPQERSTRPRPSRRRQCTARCRRHPSSWPSGKTASDMFRVFCMALMNAIPTAVTTFGATFATNAGYGVGLTTTNYLVDLGCPATSSPSS